MRDSTSILRARNFTPRSARRYRQQVTRYDRMVSAFLDDADLAVALEHRERRVGDVLQVAVEPQILEDVVLAEPAPARRCLVELAVAHDDIAAPLDQEAKTMRTLRPVGEDAMQ